VFVMLRGGFQMILGYGSTVDWQRRRRPISNRAPLFVGVPSMPSRRDTAMHRLAEAVTDRFGLDGRRPVEAVYADSEWTLEWTDGPTVEQVQRAAGAEPEAAEDVRCVRKLSEGSIALGAVRLVVSGVASARGRVPVSTAAVHGFWRSVALPAPDTDRERRLVYAAIYQVHDNHRSNVADHQEICDEIAAGLAPLAQRSGVVLTPVEALTARYAVGRDRAAWFYGLAPMPAADAFQAVCADPQASAETIAAALTLLQELPATTTAAADRLRARHDAADSQ
jgi:hypothetical protein